MDSEEQVSDSDVEEEESEEESDSGMAGIACASTPVSNFLDNNSSDDEAPAFCFMSKSLKEKVPPKHHKVYDNDQFSFDDDDHAKMIKIAKKQQYCLDKIEKTLRKCEGLLVDEMKKNQTLTEEHSALES